MSKRKGVSAEEKRTRMLQLFYEKKEFFQLKELEKIAPKEKGIISQSVKEVVQSLVDDGLVDTDKIGTSVYFWAYPSKAKHAKKRQFSELTEKLEEYDKKFKTVQELIIDVSKGRKQSETRTELLKNIEDLKNAESCLLNEVKKYQDSDPEAIEEMINETQLAKEAANRWTDNIFAVKSWCKNKFFIQESDLNKQFGIPEDLDYVE